MLGHSDGVLPLHDVGTGDAGGGAEPGLGAVDGRAGVVDAGALGWGLAASIGAVAGMLVAPIVFLDPNMMTGILVYGFAGALVGGIGNPLGAVAGGFIVGVLENLVGSYVIGNELKLTFALAVVVGVLLLKPAGIFGRVIVRRV